MLKALSVLLGVTLLACHSSQTQPIEPQLVLENCGLSIDFDLPTKYDTTYQTLHLTDFSAGQALGHGFANRDYNTIYLDTIRFFTPLDTAVAWRFEQLEFLDFLEQNYFINLTTRQERANRLVEEFRLQHGINEKFELHKPQEGDTVGKINSEEYLILFSFSTLDRGEVKVRNLHAAVMHEDRKFEVSMSNSRMNYDEFKQEGIDLLESIRVIEIE